MEIASEESAPKSATTEEEVEKKSDLKEDLCEKQNIEKTAVNSLALLAAYNSSSDSESDSENSTSSSSTSSSSSSSSEAEEETKEIVISNSTLYRDALPQMDDESDNSDEGVSDEEEKSKNQRPSSRQRVTGVKAKGEMDLCDLPPIEDLQINVREEECLHLGKILSIVEQMVLVEAKRGGAVLDLDTVLFVDRGHKVLGKIFDVLGQVNQPIYCIRFNSTQQISDKGFTVGMDVFWVAKPEHSSIVVVSNLMQQKGSDASWEHDIEPPDGCLDYSDDEQERASRQARRRPQRQLEEAPRPRQILRGQRRRANPPQRQQQQQQQMNNQQWYQYPPHPMPTWGPVFVNPFAFPMNNMPLMQQPPPPPPPPQPSVKLEHQEPPPPGCN
ncbi:hypothetical protein DMENIID0001_022410 [Sergentomyia squamirostris]